MVLRLRSKSSGYNRVPVTLKWPEVERLREYHTPRKKHAHTPTRDLDSRAVEIDRRIVEFQKTSTGTEVLGSEYRTQTARFSGGAMRANGWKAGSRA